MSKETEKNETEKTFEIILKSDYWDDNGERIILGTVLTVPKQVAVKLIKEEKAELFNSDLK